MGASRREPTITVVSGLPRSGTSLMMKMLVMGGMPALTDQVREADDDNPEGYYEYERVKSIKNGDIAWLELAQGKVVKVIAALVVHLPATYQYRVVFMKRAMPEILASQRKMLIRRGEDPDKISDEEMGRLFQKHLQQVENWMDSQPNIQRLDISYNTLLKEPLPEIDRINRFLGGWLDAGKMGEAIRLDLYRQRS